MAASDTNLVQSVTQNASALQGWFKIIARALESNPDGLFLKEIKDSYRGEAAASGKEPKGDEGTFQDSLSRQLQITLAMSNRIGWVSSTIERPTRVYPSGILRPFYENLWKLTKSGARANQWSDAKLRRAAWIHNFRFQAQPYVAKLRVPLALASAAVGVGRLISHWGELRATAEAAIAICGALFIALIHPSKADPTS